MEFDSGNLKKVNCFYMYIGIYNFSGEIAAKKNFSVTKSQPDPFGYSVMNKNPILETLADQANLDEDWPEDDLTGLKLRDDIIDAVSDNKLDWPCLLYTSDAADE